jgi:hypothetical protein
MTDSGGIPFLITAAQKAELQARGFADDQISK